MRVFLLCMIGITIGIVMQWNWLFAMSVLSLWWAMVKERA